MCIRDRSDKESNSAPNWDDFFNFLAIHPSKKSKKAASIIISTAILKLLWIENFIEEIPAISDISVIKLGINLVSGCSVI